MVLMSGVKNESLAWLTYNARVDRTNRTVRVGIECRLRWQGPAWLLIDAICANV